MDFCESTRTHQSPKRVYVWMCCLCVNQHRVVELRDQNKVVHALYGVFRYLLQESQWHSEYIVHDDVLG